MASLYTQQDSNVRKTWLLMGAFLAVVVALGWFLSYYYDSYLILVIAVVFSVLANIGSYWYSDKLVLSMSGAKPVTREQYPDLWNITENLSITAGLPMPKLYIINDPSPNAFATGRDKEHSAVAVTTGLLSLLDRSELEGVVAHELAHVGNRDILVMTIVVTLVGVVTLVADFFLRMSLYGHGGRDRGDGKMGMILLVIGIIFVILSPIIATLIKLAVSRKREFLADASGALLTRYPEGLARALQKISGSTIPLTRANHATAHLFISNPFKGTKKASFLTKLFMTHPPAEERINALLGGK
ncbi:MAG: M48 family metalloprotease [Candidatus Paceibacterota bacterium]